MITMILRHTNGEIEKIDVTNGMVVKPTEGEQFYFLGADKYTFSLADGEKSVKLYLIQDGQRIEVLLENMAELIKNNKPGDAFALNTALGVTQTEDGIREIEEAINNPEFESGEIINALKDSLATSTMAEIDGSIIDNFGSLVEQLNAAAAGGTTDEAYLSIDETREQDLTPASLDRGERIDTTPPEVTVDPDNPENTEVIVSLSGQTSVTEGELASYTITLDKPALTDMTITIVTGHITTQDDDYVPVYQDITIPAGATTYDFNVKTLDDYISDSGEQFEVGISNVQGGGYDFVVIGNDAVETTIFDEYNPGIEDTVFVRIVNDDSQIEGDTLNHKVELYRIDENGNEVAVIVPEGGEITVTIAYSPYGTNGAESDDYNAVTSVTITEGNSSAPVVITTNDDAFAEGSESYEATITDVTKLNCDFENISITNVEEDQSVIGTIHDDADGDNDTITVTLSGDTEVNEGATASYTVSVDKAPVEDMTVTVTYTYQTADSDDIKEGVTTVTIPAGQTSAPISVDALDDAFAEGDELYSVVISNPSNGGYEVVEIDNDTVQTTIHDDADGDNDTITVTLSGDTEVNEGATASYTVSVDKAPVEDMTVTVTYTYQTADSDDIKEGVTTVTIPAGQTSAPISVDALDDAFAEGDELYSVVISNPSNGGYEVVEIDNDTVQTTIHDDDNSPEAIGDVNYVVETGSENIGYESEDSEDTINNRNDGILAAVGNVIANDLGSNSLFITQVVFGNTITVLPTDGSDVTIDTPLGELVINNTGEYTYNLDDNAIDSWDETMSQDEVFTYTLSDGVNADDTAELSITIEGRDDAPVIESITTSEVTDNNTAVVSGTLDIDGDGQTDTLNAFELVREDGGLLFSEDNGNLKIDMGEGGRDMSIDYHGGTAGFKNVFGFYELDENGNPTNFKIIYADMGDEDGDGSNFDKFADPINLGVLENLEGEVGFFIIPNGNNGELADAVADILNNPNSSWTISADDTNHIVLTDGNDTITTSDTYYTDNNLSTDGRDHAIAGISEDGTGLTIGFEDLPQDSTDQDYDDFVITIRYCDTIGDNGQIFENVVLSDVDDANLQSATVTLTDGQDGDVVSVNLTQLPSGINATVNGNVVTFTNIASLSDYEDAIEAIRFETTSDDRTPRTFEIEVFDGLKHDSMTKVVNIGGCELNPYENYGDDATITIDGPDSVLEGSTTAQYTITLSEVPTQDVTLTIQTGNITTEDGDFVAITQDITIPAGTTSYTFAIDTNSDNVYEGDEVFEVKMVNVDTNSGGFDSLTVINDTVETTINDSAVYIQLVDDDCGMEGDEDTKDLTHTIKLVDENGNPIVLASGETLTVNLEYSIPQYPSGDPRNNDLTDADFEGGLTNTVTIIGDGSTSEFTFTNIILDDDLVEDGELYQLSISSIDTTATTISTDNLTIDDNHNTVIGSVCDNDESNTAPIAVDDCEIGLEVQGEFVVAQNATQTDITYLSDGGYVVVWTAEDSDGTGIYTQRYDVDGDKVGDAVLVNSFETRDQHTPHVTALSNGSYLVTWTADALYREIDSSDGGSEYIVGQVFDAHNNPVCDNTVIARAEYDPIVGLPDGGFIVTWSADSRYDNTAFNETNPIDSDLNDGDGYGIIAQRFDAMGNPVGDSIVVNQITDGNQIDSDITVLADGSAIMTWQSEACDGSYDVYTQKLILTDNGLEIDNSTETIVNTHVDGDQTDPEITALQNGAVITWEGTDGIYARLLDNNANPIGDELLITAGSADPVVSQLSDGFIVVYQFGSNIYSKTVDANGNISEAKLVSNDCTTDNEPVITTLEDGGYIIAWENENGVMAHRYNADGTDYIQNNMDMVENGSITISIDDLLANDYDDEDGSNVTFNEIVQVNNGTVVVNNDGTITFTATPGYSGDEAGFTYTVVDSEGAVSNEAKVCLNVKDVADPIIFVGTVCDADIQSHDIVVNEGEQAILAVKISGAIEGSSVTLALADGTALNTEDYDSTFEYSYDGINWQTYTGSIPVDGSENILVKMTTVDDNVDELDELFNLHATLSTGQSDSGTVTIIDNDEPTQVPVSIDENIDIECETAVTNVTFIVDVSSSMSNSDLALTEEAIANLIAQYEDMGEVNVNIIQTWGGAGSDGTGLETTGWTDSSIDVDGLLLTDKSGTDFDQGLESAVDAYSNTPAEGNDVIYFFADGNTYDSYETDFNNYLPTWNQFIEENNIELHTIGVNCSQLDDLDAIASSSNVDPVYVDDISDLPEVVSTITNTVYISGTLMDNVDFDADGDFSDTGTLRDITIDGVTYTADSFPDDGVTTNEGGNFTLNFENGVYSYSIDGTQQTDGVISENFTITAVNDSGETTSFNMTIDGEGCYISIPTSINLIDEDCNTELSAYFDDANDIDLADILPADQCIDILDLNNNTDDTVKIDLQSVLDLTDCDNNLVVIGNNGDKIDFNDNEDWELKATNQTVDGQGDSTFTEYTSSSNPNISVFVEDEIQTDI